MLVLWKGDLLQEGKQIDTIEFVVRLVPPDAEDKHADLLRLRRQLTSERLMDRGPTTRPSPLTSREVAEAFLAAVTAGEEDEAVGMAGRGSAIPQQIEDFQELVQP